MNWTHLKGSFLKNVPWPVIVPFIIVIGGGGISSIWRSGYATFSLKNLSMSCLFGGASLWFWVGFKIFHEQQKVENYKCIPLASKSPNNNEITKWYKQTRVKKATVDYTWIFTNLALFGLYVIFALLFFRIKYFEDKNNLIYAFSIAFYLFTCVLNPAYYMVDYNE